MRTHFVIPDTQAKAGVPVDHLVWIGQYIVDQFAGQDLEIVHLGDHADMPSLSSYDKGKRAMEGRRYDQDIAAANHAFDALNAPLDRYRALQIKDAAQRKKKVDLWKPSKRLLLGNHENRITRATEYDAQLEGTLSLDDLNYKEHGWQVHDFLEPVLIDGITYSHYFYQPNSGRPYSGMIETRLKAIGCSFTMGHQQMLLYGMRYVMGQSHHGLVCGSCYLHEEEYRGPQAQAHWRGVVVCHEVRGDGGYDPMFVSLDFLCRKYEGASLAEFMLDTYGVRWIGG